MTAPEGKMNCSGATGNGNVVITLKYYINVSGGDIEPGSVLFLRYRGGLSHSKAPMWLVSW